MRHRNGGRTAAAFLAVLAAALLASAASPCAAGDSPGPLRIGLLAPLSGPYASGGSSLVQAATLAAERANAAGGILGRPVEIVSADTQGRIDIAKLEALRLLSREKVFALVGAYLSEESVGVMEVAAENRRIVVVPVAATLEITDRVRNEREKYRGVFRASYSIPQWAEMTARFLASRKVRTYAYVGAGIRWNRELARALEKSLKDRGIVPVYEAFYSPSNPAIEPVAAAAAAKKPDILVLGDPGRNAVAFVKRLRETAPALPVFSVGGTLGDERLATSLPLAAPLYVQAAAWKGGSPAATEYAEAFEARYGYAPSGYSDTLPYDAVLVLLAAIRNAGRADTPAVIAALETGSFAATAGTYRFDASHQALWGSGPGGLEGTVVRWDASGATIVFPVR